MPASAKRFKSSGNSSRQNNASGYAKRKSSKASNAKGKAVESTDDVYEYEAEKTRRGKVRLLLEKDELLGAGPSSGFRGSGSEDENEDDGRRRLQPRLVGEENDEDGIQEDEDEEIDSDEAFEESDEERFAGFDFSSGKNARRVSNSKTPAIRQASSQSKSVRFTEVDLNEDSDDHVDPDPHEESSDEEEEEEGEPEEFIDVLDILDGRGEADSEEDTGKTQREDDVKVEAGRPLSDEESQLGDGESGDSDSEDEDDGDEQASPIAIFDDDMDVELEPDDNALQSLETFINTLDSSHKRKMPDGEDSALLQTHAQDDRMRKRRVILPEVTQTGMEGEFAAQPGTTKLNLDDLLAPLASTSTAASSTLQSFKKSVKVLASQSSKAQTLAAPLPQRTQDRLDREAAYEQTTGEIDKWNATMKRIKEAEHLSFPLQAEVAGKVSNLELAAKFKPTTEMESAVDRLLKSARMREQDLAQTESLEMNHLSIEEVAERRAELSKMRELMFRAEAKAKRVKKIKSKTYRRIRKKEKERLAKKLGEVTDGHGDEDEEDEERRLKKEVERARERATLRHKNTGKWAKAMRSRGELDDDQRREINDMLDRGEKLRRRIHGKGSDDESDEEPDSDDESDGDDPASAVKKIKASAFDELESLNAKPGDEEDVGGGKKGKSVFEMKFMKNAMAREQQQADQLADDFLREIGGFAGENDEDGDASHTGPSEGGSSQRIGGRVSYRPGDTAGALRVQPSLASDTSSVTLKSTDLLPGGPGDSPAPVSPTVERTVPYLKEDVNPWLAVAAGPSQKTTRSKHEVVVSKESGSADKSKHKLRKRAKKREEEKAKANDDAAVDVEMANVLSLGANAESLKAGPSGSSRRLQADIQGPETGGDDDDSGADSELEAQEQALLMRKGKGRSQDLKAFEQRELVARAFAGDNVVREFAEEKRREIEADAPKEVDMTLAGWGSWGGAGVKKSASKPYLIKKIAGVDPKTRTDYKKAHVIISEKRDKKAAKYLIKDLPYPYTSKAQFERSMDTPLGSEWNTRVGFQRGTLPKVTKKMGTVITPLEKLF